MPYPNSMASEALSVRECGTCTHKAQPLGYGPCRGCRHSGYPNWESDGTVAAQGCPSGYVLLPINPNGATREALLRALEDAGPSQFAGTVQGEAGRLYDALVKAAALVAPPNAAVDPRSPVANQLRELIDRYWGLAYAEGQEGRDQDTEDGAAQQCRGEIEEILRAIDGATPAQTPGARAGEASKTLPAETLVQAAPFSDRLSELAMLGYELDGVLADFREDPASAPDSVCIDTIVRVRSRLAELCRPPQPVPVDPGSDSACLVRVVSVSGFLEHANEGEDIVAYISRLAAERAAKR